jgi:hypothetical protein
MMFRCLLKKIKKFVQYSALSSDSIALVDCLPLVQWLEMVQSQQLADIATLSQGSGLEAHPDLFFFKPFLSISSVPNLFSLYLLPPPYLLFLAFTTYLFCSEPFLRISSVPSLFSLSFSAKPFLLISSVPSFFSLSLVLQAFFPYIFFQNLPPFLCFSNLPLFFQTISFLSLLLKPLSFSVILKAAPPRHLFSQSFLIIYLWMTFSSLSHIG